MKKKLVFVFLVIALILGLVLATRLHGQDIDNSSFLLTGLEDNCLVYFSYQGMAVKVIFYFNSLSHERHFATAGRLINYFCQHGFKFLAEPPTEYLAEITIRQTALYLPWRSHHSPSDMLYLATGYDLIYSRIKSPFKKYIINVFPLKTSHPQSLDCLVLKIMHLINRLFQFASNGPPTCGLFLFLIF
jgi:hypothetical protein